MAQATTTRRTVRRPIPFVNGWSVGRRRLSPGDLATAESSARTTIMTIDEAYRILAEQQGK